MPEPNGDQKAESNVSVISPEESSLEIMKATRAIFAKLHEKMLEALLKDSSLKEITQPLIAQKPTTLDTLSSFFQYLSNALDKLPDLSGRSVPLGQQLTRFQLYGLDISELLKGLDLGYGALSVMKGTFGLDITIYRPLADGTLPINIGFSSFDTNTPDSFGVIPREIEFNQNGDFYIRMNYPRALIPEEPRTLYFTSNLVHEDRMNKAETANGYVKVVTAQQLHETKTFPNGNQLPKYKQSFTDATQIATNMINIYPQKIASINS